MLSKLKFKHFRVWIDAIIGVTLMASVVFALTHEKIGELSGKYIVLAVDKTCSQPAIDNARTALRREGIHVAIIERENAVDAVTSGDANIAVGVPEREAVKSSLNYKQTGVAFTVFKMDDMGAKLARVVDTWEDVRLSIQEDGSRWIK